MLSPSHDPEYFDEIHYASASVITTNNGDYELDNVTKNQPGTSGSEDITFTAPYARQWPSRPQNKRPLRRSPGRCRQKNSNTKRYAKLLAGTTSSAIYDTVTPTLARKPIPKRRKKKPWTTEVEKDRKESSTGFEHSKTVCVLLAIIVLALMISLAAIALGLYNIASLEREKKDFVRQSGQCTNTSATSCALVVPLNVSSHQDNSTENLMLTLCYEVCWVAQGSGAFRPCTITAVATTISSSSSNATEKQCCSCLRGPLEDTADNETLVCQSVSIKCT